jgi:plasmid replication initiation protein
MDIKKKRLKGNAERERRNEADIFLKKHVGLIHCENKLTLIQRKICNILLFNALDKINDQETHEISLQKLCSLVGYNSNDTKLIKDSIKSLISTVMEWNLLEDSKFLNEDDYPEDAITWNASSLLAGASIKGGLIRYSYSPQMKSVLSSLDIYGRINLFVQAKFNSTYSLVLYENCVRFKTIHQTSWMPLDLFRSLMGVPVDKYPAFKEFKRNVLNVAVKEVNQKSDIYIEPQFRKAGRSVSAIQFLITENSSYQPSFKKLHKVEVSPPTAQQKSTVLEILVSEFSLSEKQANQTLSAYTNDYIIEKINLVKAKKNIEHLGAYLLSALKKDYQKGTGRPAPKLEKVPEASYLREAKEASEILPLKKKYMSYRLKAYTNFIQQQAENVQAAIRDKFEQLLKPNAQVFRFYKKDGLASPYVMSDFMGFIDTHYSHIVGEYLSFDDYITADDV